MTPAERMTSRVARTTRRSPPSMSSTPTARRPSKSTRATTTPLRTRRFGRLLAGSHVRLRGAVAEPAARVHLAGADAELGGAVVVVEDGHAAGLGDGVDQRGRRGHQILRPGHRDGAAGAAVLVGAALPVLQALVAAHGVRVAPAGAALGQPVVVVLPVAAHVHHAVDGARIRPAPCRARRACGGRRRAAGARCSSPSRTSSSPAGVVWMMDTMPGTVQRRVRSVPPASSRSTRHAGSSVRRAAMMPPAEPAPTTM